MILLRLIIALTLGGMGAVRLPPLAAAVFFVFVFVLIVRFPEE